MDPAYLLDSNVCIALIRRHATPLALPSPQATAVSSVVAAELWAGAEKSLYRQEAGRVESLLEAFPVLSFDFAAARHYGNIRADLERKGTPIGPLDLLIAAHARSLGLTLVTGNIGEFRRVDGLNVLMWP